MTIEQTLEQRGNVHGEFGHNAYIAVTMLDVMQEHGNWEKLGADQKQALIAITGKISRILSGDPDYPDHWHDIGGYARLVENRLTFDLLKGA